MTIDTKALEEIGHRLILELGEDPERDGLKDTPRRWARWWQAFVDYDPGTIDTAFEIEAADNVVAVTGLRAWTLCEHHLLPFWVDVDIAYIPQERVLGLSKFARLVHKIAHRLQVQERLTNQIADAIIELTGTEDVAVISRGQHLCMTMRGIRTRGDMVVSTMRGVFRSEPSARAEFLALTKRGESRG